MSEPLADKIQFLDVVLDTVQQSLTIQSQTIDLEPKVFEVCCYLIQQRSRYVSLQELHEVIWAGRVVSDTAVRRTISKLRAVLHDNDLEQPRFVRSGMKKGYQWLVEPVVLVAAQGSLPGQNPLQAEPVSLPADDAVLPPAVAAMIESSPQYHQPGSAISPAQTGWRRPAAWLAAGVLVVVCLSVLWFWPQSTAPGGESAKGNPVEVLVDIPGMKSILSSSQRGEQLAFMAMIDGQFDLYVYQRSNGTLQKVPTKRHGTDTVYFAEFIDSDRYLLYGTFGKVPAYYLQPLADLTAQPVRIDTSRFAAIGGSPLPVGERQFLLAAKLQASDSMTYFRYDLQSLKWTPFTHNYQSGEADMKARLSPDGRKVAMLRANNSPEPSMRVQVYQIDSGELLQNHVFNQYFFNLEWLDDQQLVLVPGQFAKHLFRLDLNSGQLAKTAVERAYGEFRRSQDGKHWFAIEAPDVKPPRFQLASLPYTGHDQQIFSIAGVPVNLAFSNKMGVFWLVERQNGQYQLSSYQVATGKKTSVLTQAAPMRVLAQHPRLPEILLGSDRLLLVNPDTGERKALTSNQQKIENAYFHPADDAVYFAEQVANQWRINKYGLQTQLHSTVITDYRYLHAWQQFYIALDVSGQFWLLDQQFNRLRQLPLKSEVEFVPAQIFLQDDMLTVVQMNNRWLWQLQQYDLATGQQQSWQLPVNPVRDPNAVSVHNQQVLFANWLQVSSPVLRLSHSPLPVVASDQ